jgi:NAD(P)-dependent dehydrogenase (short-subunit alcohol dehydrogenase family)
MQGKVVVLTGGTSGIGEAAAIQLASMGARLVLVARDASRAEETLKRLRKISSGAANAHAAHVADLSLVSETRRVAREIAAAEPRIDVLINNAGLIAAQRQVTAEGYELTFATNHMAYFVLTQGLLPRLLDSAPARIVNTASEVHRGAKLDFGDLQSQHGYSGFGVYAKSKLANILFSNELARRLSSKGVTANSLHPGVVASRLGLHREGQRGDPSSARFLSAQGISPEEGAETIVYLASFPDGADGTDAANASGQYFNQSRAIAPSKEAQDRVVAQRLWKESERLAGIEYEPRGYQAGGVRLGGPRRPARKGATTSCRRQPSSSSSSSWSLPSWARPGRTRSPRRQSGT